MRVVKRITRRGEQEKDRGGNVEGSIIIEVDEITHEEILRKEKLSVGLEKMPGFRSCQREAML